MKKKSFFLSLAASVLLTTSCSLDELGGSKGGDVRLISATQTSFGAIEEETRSVVDPTTSPISFKWAEGDHLAIYSGGSASGLTNFDLVDGINSSVATFKPNGFGLMVGSPYYAFSPYDGTQIDKNAIAVNYEGQVQTANAAFAHLGGKDFQYSSATTAASVSADKMTNFTLAHLGSVCRFQLTVPEDGVYTEFTLSGTGLVSKGKLNITTASFTPEQTGSLTMSLGTGIKVAANSVLILYMMLPPQDLSACPDLTATLCTADKQYVATLTSKNILSGKAYGWSAAVTSSDSDDNVLPGTFSVSATKQVQFTKSNLYWNGSAYKFEANQTDYPTEWNPNHVGHFYWTNLTDYQSGNASYMPYAEEYSYSSQSTSDKFFCGEENPLTVEGTSNLFVLSRGEWDYLIKTRANATNLYKYGVTVGTKANCLIIAPDNFNGTLKSSYTLDEVSSLGLVCLPAVGWRNGTSFGTAEIWGACWSSTPDSDYLNCSYFLTFNSGQVYTSYGNYGRVYGHSVRLVRLASGIGEGGQTPVSSIVLSSSNLSLQVGGSSTLTVTVSPSDASDLSLAWTSSDTSIATVNSSGVVTAVSAGTATITCMAQDGSGVKATCTVNVLTTDPISAHEYVEIGGKKWATMNLGATTVAGSLSTCAGDYYAWGETTPRYTGISWSGTQATLTGLSKAYNSSNYPSYTGTTLDAAHDAVASHADWGEGWRTPTKSDFESLAVACAGSSSNEQTPKTLNTSTPSGGIYWLSSTQTYLNEYKGVAGLLFVDRNDTSKRVFFPASGNVYGTSHGNGGSIGICWSSSLGASGTGTASSLYFNSSRVVPLYSNFRYGGFAVRPVSD